MKRFLALLFVVFSFPLLAFDLLEEEIDPSYRVEGVNVFTGRFSFLEEDHVVDAPIPIRVTRYYYSGSVPKNFGEFALFPQRYFKVSGEPGKREILIGFANGSIAKFKEGNQGEFSLDIGKKWHLVSNTSRGKLSRWTNLRNYKIHEEKDQFLLLIPDGTRRKYKKQPSSNSYVLSAEFDAFGNQIVWEYDKGARISKIRSVDADDSIEFGSVEFSYDDHSLTLTTSDQQQIVYRFEDNAGKKLLKEIEGPKGKACQYSYQVGEDDCVFTHMNSTDGSSLSIEYSDAKVNSITMSEYKNEAIVFEYDETGCRVQAPQERILDFHVDKRRKVTSVGRYLKEDLLRYERKVWTGQGNLVGEFMQSVDGHVPYYIAYAYDSEFNLTSKRHYGDFQGKNGDSVTLNKLMRPAKGQEVYSESYEYSSGKESDVDVITDSKGITLRKFYKKDTNVIENEQIILPRHYKKEKKRTYGKYGILTHYKFDHTWYGDSKSSKYHSLKISEETPNIGKIKEIKWGENAWTMDYGMDAFGGQVSYEYDGKGNLKELERIGTDGKFSHKLSYGYDENERQTLSTDPMGIETTTFYNSEGRVEKVIRDQQTIEYVYNSQGLLEIERQTRGRGTTHEQSYEYDTYGNLLSNTDYTGCKTRYEYDDLDRLVGIFAGESKKGYRYSYDAFDNCIKVTDPFGKSVKTAYTPRGLPRAIHYPDGTQEKFKYDSEGSLHRFCRRDGIIEVAEYDEMGKLSLVERYERDNRGKRDGFERLKFAYDRLGRYERFSDIENTTQYKYLNPNCWRQKTESDDTVSTVDYHFDSLGRVQFVDKHGGDNKVTCYGEHRDLNGRLTAKTIQDQNGILLFKEEYVYNSIGELTDIIGYPNNKKTVLSHFVYDDVGNISQKTDARGNVYRYQHYSRFDDSSGQILRVFVEIDPQGNRSEFQSSLMEDYLKGEIKDIEGKLLQSSLHVKDEKFQASQKHSHISNGSKIGEFKALEKDGLADGSYKQLSVNGAESNKQVITYNSRGEVEKIELPNFNEPLHFEHNNKGYLERIHLGDSEEVSFSYKLDYNRNGHLRCQDFGETRILERVYGAFGRVEEETLFDSDEEEFKVGFAYNRDGAIKTITLPDGSQLAYSYSGPFVSSMTRKSKGGSAQYVYAVDKRDLAGLPTTESLPSGLKVLSKYGPDGRKVSVDNGVFKQTIPDKGIDSLGNILQVELESEFFSESHEFKYDALSRITEEQSIDFKKFTYDSLGNRLTEGKEKFKYGQLNELQKAPRETLVSDVSGHPSSKTVDSNEVEAYQIDPFGRISKISLKDGKTIQYVYDLEGRRLSKKVAKRDKEVANFTYFYLGEYELGAIDQKGNIVELRIPADPNAPERSSIVAIELEGESYTVLEDLHGNVKCLLSTQDDLVLERYEYSAFGEEVIFDEGDETIEKSGLRNPWRYQGKRVDEDTGLVFFGKRYYNPDYGRWMTPDPLGFVDGPNLYCYAHNNPFKYKDLDGFNSEKEGIDSEFDQYFYGEVEPHCVCETHRKCKKGGTSGFAFWRSARFNGASRAFWGILEGSAGAGGIYGSGGLAAPIGWAMLVHGVDEFAAGMYTLVTGEEAVSGTEVLLVNSGLTPETAVMMNDGISTLLSGGRAKMGKVAVGFSAVKRGSALKSASSAGKIATQASKVRGWKVGQPVNNLTRRGNIPKWSTVRQRYWKNQAHFYPEKYRKSQLTRMKKGLAPQQLNRKTGKIESMELHHNPPQREGGLFDVIELWPDEHAANDHYRRLSR